MIKKRILLASVLKPINDTRMYGKLGVSLAKLPQTEIHLAGFQAPEPPAPENMFFHPVFRFRRLSWRRFLAPLYFFKLVWKLSPQLIILGTHELLFVSLIYKLFRPCRLVYDVRENYFLNLTSQQVYSPFTSRLLAYIIRGTETLAAPFVACFFLAEKSYAGQLPFVRAKYLILENKFQPRYPLFTPPPRAREIKIPDQQVQLLYSGTISELYGVFRALAFCEALNRVTPIYYLTIMGYCPQPEVLAQLQAIIAGNARVKLIGGDKLVPHHQILEAIGQSHAGLLPYIPHPSTANCIPTKLYEYLGHNLPVIFQHNPLWAEAANYFKAGLGIDFQYFLPDKIHAEIHSRVFYSGQDLSPAYWLTEEKKLLTWAQTTI